MSHLTDMRQHPWAHHVATYAREHAPRLIVVSLYICATLQFVRYYIRETPAYLDMGAYLAGQERLPFQTRILPALLLKGLALLLGSSAKDDVYGTMGLPVVVLNFASMLVAGLFTYKLYKSVTTRHRLGGAIYPVLLFAVTWSYLLHNEANFSYPYDLLSVALFAAGYYFILSRSYTSLVWTVFFASLNRETAVFLIVLFAIDSAWDKDPNGIEHRQHWMARVPWVRLLSLLLLWASVEFALFHHFRNNDPSEFRTRFGENLHLIRPRMLPALLNVCGYLLPIVVIFRARIRNRRFASYLWVLPVWVVVSFFRGVIVETRIYGELCPFVAVAIALILEDGVSAISRKKGEKVAPALAAVHQGII